jgi:hypothetical protein
MRLFSRLVMLLALMPVVAPAQVRPPIPADTDIYRVVFVKALPSQAGNLAAELLRQDAKDPLASHFLLLRHQQGDDWDYCLIQHLGTRLTVTVSPPAPAAPQTRAWHTDTLVSGPSWTDFTRLMNGGVTSLYVASVHRAVPGRREQLLELLTRPASGKTPVAQLTLTHIDGSAWHYLQLRRYNSWQDFGSARAAAGGAELTDTNQNSAYHADTLADRVR